MKRERIEEILEVLAKKDGKIEGGWDELYLPQAGCTVGELKEVLRLALRATDPEMMTIPVDRLNQARHWASWHVTDDPDAVDFVDWVESIAPTQEQQEMEERE